MTSEGKTDRPHYTLLDSNGRSEDYYDTGSNQLLLVQDKGITPIDILPHDSAIVQGSTEPMEKEDDDTPNANGNASRSTVLHIPGESGELANSECSDECDSEESRRDMLTDTTEFYAKILAQKLKYKLIFTISIVTLLVLAYASALFPWFIPYYHTVVFPILVIIRVYNYSKVNWQLFCLDFCYFANVALLVFCWAYPQSEVFFAIVFGATMGPLAVAVLVFRNSAVFHDYDRMTSAYIHVVPVLITYIIKWFPEKTSINWYFAPNTTFLDKPMMTQNSSALFDYIPQGVDITWIFVTIIPLIWFTMHTVMYMLIENCAFGGNKYLTSYKWLTSNTKSSIYHILTLCGRITNQSKVKFSWLMFNILYCTLSVLAARLVWEYFIAHTVYLVLIYLVVIYNGASFYIDVFAQRGLKKSSNR